MRKLIGKGTFSRAYQISETQVELVSTCPTKECYCLFSQNNPLAPKIERVFGKENTYLMPLYPKMKAPKKQLNAQAYELYSALKRYALNGEGCIGYHTFAKKINEFGGMTEEQKENICSLAGDVCNNMDCEDMRFEISPRNISCDEQGNLILLDCFFSSQALSSSWRR